MGRNAYFDNARIILIFLVVFGHIIQPFIGNANEIHTLYTWVYFFHMPAFILISGFFARGSGDKKYIRNLIQKLLWPYLIFQIIYTGYYYLIAKPDWMNGLFYPHWALWFLVSLFCWHLLLYFFKKIKPSHGMILAVAIGLGIGYLDPIGHTFSLSRTFVFFPFFLAGYWVKEAQLKRLKHKAVKFAGLAVLSVFAVIVYLLPDLTTGWLLHSSSYAALGGEEYGALVRLLVYFISAVMTVSVLAWIPQRKITGLTYIGSRTLSVYLLHGFVVQFFRQAEIFNVNNLIDVIGLIAISAALVYLLSTNTVIGIAQPLLEGKATWYKEKLEEKKTQTDL